MSNYVVEKKESSGWIPKMRCNFEDTEQFLAIAKNQFYRILCDGKDVTSKYRNGKVKSESVKESTSAAAVSVMKPSQYKALSTEAKHQIYQSVNRCLSQKMKRSEIFKELNISEATYDAIRADMQSDAVKDSSRPAAPTGKLRQRSLI